MEQVTITSVRWIPRGAAKPEPVAEELAPEDIRAIVDEMKDLEQQGQLSEQGFSGVEDEARDGDSEDTESTNQEDERLATKDFYGRQFFSAMETDLPEILDDPYLKPAEDDLDSEEANDREAQHIRSTDCMLIAASAEQELPTLEIYVYDHDTSAFYVHHEIMVGAPPLCIEWLPSLRDVAQGNFCAVGSFGHGMIEIWDLDVMDQLEPVATLGQPPARKNKRKSKSSGVPGHTAPVLSLHKNPEKAGGADETVRLWDLTQLVNVTTYKHHTDKVQTVQWHPIEEPVLLTAGYDHVVAVIDARSSSSVLKASLTSDAEACIWDRHHPTTCWVTLEDGHVVSYDIRTLSHNTATSRPLWTLEAHDQACTSIADCSISSMMVTCSVDGTAKIWQVQSDEKRPHLVTEKELKAGPIFSVANNPDEPTVFSFAAAVPVIWDVAESNLVNRAFGLPCAEESS